VVIGEKLAFGTGDLVHFSGAGVDGSDSTEKSPSHAKN
jgi:hypothetical protein